MKTVLLSITLLSLLLLSCSSGEDVKNEGSKVITQRDLESKDAPKVTEEHIVMMSMEHGLVLDSQNGGELKRDKCFIFTPTKDLTNILIDIDKDLLLQEVTIKDPTTDTLIEVYKDASETFVDFKEDVNYTYCAKVNLSEEKREALFIYFDALADPSQAPRRASGESIRVLKNTNKCTGNKCDLTKADLTQMYLVDANLSGAKMYYAILSGANLSHADLRDTKLSHVDLTEAILDYTTITDPNFSFINVQGASFRGTKFPTEFKFSSSPTAPQTSAPYYDEVNFTEANLSTCLLNDVDFTGTNFTNADLSSTNIFATNFTNANLTGVNLAHLTHINSSTNFTNAILNDVSFDALRTINRSEAILKNTEISFFEYKEELQVGNYSCNNLPYAQNVTTASLCTTSTNDEFGMLFLSEYEYMTKEPQKNGYTCSSVEIASHRKGSFEVDNVLSYICFLENKKISVKWNSDTEIDSFTQKLQEEYSCTVPLSSYCQTPQTFSIVFE